MIPQFPQFKKLELTDREAVLAITTQFSPYSDFDFGSMWAWDFSERMFISNLNGNLVIKFTDYMNGEYFYTFIGREHVSKTANELISHATAIGIQTGLKLIPEVVALKLDSTLFSITEDSDNLDYVLSVEKLASYDGPELASKRRALNIFMRRTPNYRFEIIDLESEKVRYEIDKLFIVWHTQKIESGDLASDSAHEYTALKRCIASAGTLNLTAAGLYIEDRLVAFWVLGLLNNGYSISHFEKADIKKYQGIFPFFKKLVAEHLLTQKITRINLEQDLGIPGLRQSKKAYFPVEFLHKYKVTRH